MTKGPPPPQLPQAPLQPILQAPHPQRFLKDFVAPNAYRYRSPILVPELLHAVVSHGASPAQMYWETKLPNTPMRKSIQEFSPKADYSAQGGVKLFLASGEVLKSKIFSYKHAGTEEELATSSNADIFFVEHQLDNIIQADDKEQEEENEENAEPIVLSHTRRKCVLSKKV
ncbi:hypothetical protein QQ045_006138 [Rhodiola kirilowii]